MAKNLSIVAQGISGEEGKLLGYNVSDNGIYTPAIGDVVRGTSATYVAQDGTIKTAPPNVARVDYTNGVAELLLEPSSTNYVLNSYDFTQWSNGANSLTPNYAISPDGNQNATRITFSANQVVSQSTSVPIGVTATASIYIKGNNGKTITLNVGGVDVTHTLIGEWQRLESTGTTANGNIIISTYGGVTANDILVWGAQMEQGDFATSYIPTNVATATRSADSLTNFGSTQIIDTQSGILFFEGSALSNDLTYRTISLGNGNEGIVNLFYNNASNTIVCSAENILIIAQVPDITKNTKFVVRYATNDFTLFANGVQIGQDTSGYVKANLLRFDFNNGAGGSPFYGRIRQVKHLPYNTDISKL